MMSLLKFDNAVLISKSSGRVKEQPLNVNPLDPANYNPDTPSSPSSSSGFRKNQNRVILNSILPPRKWVEGNQLWVQEVSSAPGTRTDVIHLEEELDKKLLQREARQTGICPIRRELYSQCFDELIRHVTMNCAERGMLMLRVRNEIQMTLETYQKLYESSVASGVRKAFQAVQDKAGMEERNSDLENENQDLKSQLSEQKARCELIERRESENAQTEERMHNEEIQLLKKVNQQLKAQLEERITPKMLKMLTDENQPKVI